MRCGGFGAVPSDKPWMREGDGADLEHSLQATLKVELPNASFRDGLYYRPAIQATSKVILREEQWENLFYWLAGHPGAPSSPWGRGGGGGRGRPREAWAPGRRGAGRALAAGVLHVAGRVLLEDPVPQMPRHGPQRPPRQGPPPSIERNGGDGGLQTASEGGGLCQKLNLENFVQSFGKYFFQHFKPRDRIFPALFF
jgi:hypothetical protein